MIWKGTGASGPKLLISTGEATGTTSLTAEGGHELRPLRRRRAQPKAVRPVHAFTARPAAHASRPAAPPDPGDRARRPCRARGRQHVGGAARHPPDRRPPSSPRPRDVPRPGRLGRRRLAPHCRGSSSRWTGPPLRPFERGLDASEHVDFASPRLPPSFVFVRNPARGSWSLRERPGFLRLWGQAASLSDLASPSARVPAAAALRDGCANRGSRSSRGRANEQAGHLREGERAVPRRAPGYRRRTEGGSFGSSGRSPDARRSSGGTRSASGPVTLEVRATARPSTSSAAGQGVVCTSSDASGRGRSRPRRSCGEPVAPLHGRDDRSVRDRRGSRPRLRPTSTGSTTPRSVRRYELNPLSWPLARRRGRANRSATPTPRAGFSAHRVKLKPCSTLIPPRAPFHRMRPRLR